MNILITGSTGMLGSALATHLSSNYKVFGIDIHPENIKNAPQVYQQCDITDVKSLQKIITDVKPSIIINCAANTSVDGCEKDVEKARAINVGGVQNLVQILAGSNMHLIQISTDYIFDGTAGPYSENDKTNPINNYGKMKLESELELVQSNVNWTILRTNVLFSDNLTEPASFVAWVYQNLKKNEKINVVNDQFGNPTYVYDFTRAIERVIERDAHGIFHYGGKDYVNRFEFALQIADTFGLDNRLINKITTRFLKQLAPRPYKAGLKTNKIETELEISTSNLKDVLESIKRSGETDE
ncbi:MAG: dTDP-4-dehydrorhamnose reductase [Candidatus Marinimicrobia bacterium]|nr:dTDP-4-dehydrorhamnose reductase [Candidatus Neomarinimicrobiota bacterium]